MFVIQFGRNSCIALKRNGSKQQQQQQRAYANSRFGIFPAYILLSYLKSVLFQ